MTWDELSNFTWGEAENFTWDELELDANELLTKVKENNSDVPHDVMLKLKGLCTDLNVSDPDITSSTTSQKMSVADALKIISAIVGLAIQAPDLYEKYKPYVISVLHELKRLIFK